MPSFPLGARSIFRVPLLVACVLIARAASAQIVATDLGTLGGALSRAVAINASGQVVGSSTLPDSSTHAFSWTKLGGMVDLGTLGGVQSLPTAVSETGQVVGSSITAAGSAHAFSWTPGTSMIDLGNLPGGTDSFALAVNGSGQVVGYATVALGSLAPYHAFLWTPGTGMMDLGTLGGAFSQADAINASGEIVGYANTLSSAPERAFSWTQAGMVNLGTLGFAGPGFATALNDSGQIVGYQNVDTNIAHGFSWTPASGMMVDVGTLGGNQSVATAVNASGQVAGYAATPANGPAVHAFIWTQAGGMVDLGTLGGIRSLAFAINASAQIVGNAFNAGGIARAFSWTAAGGMIDLGTLGGTASGALAVNDDGQIVGVANLAGDTTHHAVVWTIVAPVVTLTAPSPVVTFSAAGGAVSFTVSSTAGTPACTADGSPFVSGGVLSLGTHVLVCTATDPVTHLTGTASASVIVVLSGPAGPQGPAGPAGPPGPQGPASSQLWNAYVRGHLTDVFTASTFTSDGPITMTRIQVQLRTAPKNCNVNAVIQVSQGATVKTITLTALANDSGTIAVNFAAAAPILVGVSKGAKGCGIDPANANILVQYKGK